MYKFRYKSMMQMMYLNHVGINNIYINMVMSLIINLGYLFPRIVPFLFHYPQLVRWLDSYRINIRYLMSKYTWKYEEAIFHQRSFGIFSKITLYSIYFDMTEIMPLLQILPDKPDTSINYARLITTCHPFATDSHWANDNIAHWLVKNIDHKLVLKLLYI